MAIDVEKFKKSKHKIVGRRDCPSFKDALKILNLKQNSSKVITKWKEWKKKGALTSPTIILNNKIVATGPNKWKKYLKKYFSIKKNSFGNTFQPRNWKTTNVLGSGSYRSPGSKDYIPQPGWGKFSGSAGANRAGNAIPCQSSSNWLYKDRSSPNFPIQRITPKDRRLLMASSMSFGLLPSVSQKTYNHRGQTGFDQVPKSIYMREGGNVFDRSYSPYSGARKSGILPRPYGPRDQAAIKGYPNSPLLRGNIDTKKYYKKYPNRYGSKQRFGQAVPFGPFINQHYTESSTSAANQPMQFGQAVPFGPFINQHYTESSTSAANQPMYGRKKKKRKVKFGRSPDIPRMTGWKNAKPLFRPHYLKNWNPGYNSFANKDLYIPTWNPYQGHLGRTQQQQRIAKGSKLSNAQNALQANPMGLSQVPRSNFGYHQSGYNYMGPNMVAYENPMLMYSGAGSNTVNYLTGRNYLKPCNSNNTYPYLKVQKNNNPRGYLSNSKVVPLSGVKSNYGRRKSKFGEEWNNRILKLTGINIDSNYTDVEILTAIINYINNNPQIKIPPKYKILSKFSEFENDFWISKNT